MVGPIWSDQAQYRVVCHPTKISTSYRVMSGVRRMQPHDQIVSSVTLSGDSECQLYYKYGRDGGVILKNLSLAGQNDYQQVRLLSCTCRNVMEESERERRGRVFIDKNQSTFCVGSSCLGGYMVQSVTLTIDYTPDDREVWVKIPVKCTEWNSLVPESWKTFCHTLYDVLTPHTMSKLMRVLLLYNTYQWTHQQRRKYRIPVWFIRDDQSSQGRSTEHSRVEIDLDAGGVTGYSDQVQFPVTPKQRSDKDRRCSQQAVIRLELGGQMQIASLTMEYKEDPPRLWTFHMSDSEKAEGYGSITITNSSLKGSLEMHVVNQQLRLYSRWPRSTQEVPAATPSHSQWMSVRIVDSTAKKLSKVELTLSMRGNSLRWQDGRLAHDFSAPPGLYYDNESIKNKSIIYVGLNRVIGADWRSGTGLCKVIVKLMDNEDRCDGKMMNCDPNAYCKFTRKSYRCSCKKGWEGDGKKCRDPPPLPPRKCSCRPGFVADPFDPHNCVDVDECHIKNGGCKERCINTIGSFYCLCAEPGHTSSSCIVEVKVGFGNQINLCWDRGSSPGPPAQKSDTLLLDRQVN
uniref:EGF-like domain-containing protein n=1 Tax=Timema cristinae TaxID=61476 RepID=A0A7R9CIR4_TIMCR|nr:unnamed protein product [Timema cristinae]